MKNAQDEQRLHNPSNCAAPRILTRSGETYHRLSRKLHDELGQSMTALRLQLAILEHNHEWQSTEMRQHLSTAIAMVDTTMEDLRALSHWLYPAALEATSFSQAMQDACWRISELTQVKVIYKEKTSDQIPEYLKLLLYRFVQETLQKASLCDNMLQIAVCLEQDAEQVALVMETILKTSQDGENQKYVVEWNDGFDEVRDQVDLLGGKLFVDTDSGPGPSISLMIPLPEEL